jgi:hypothetical protein
MLYFLDPVLSARAAMKPPNQFLAIEEETVVRQRAINRTRNRISRTETIPVESEHESDVDRGFNEEYHLTKGV